MSEDSAGCPAPGALAEDGRDAGSAAPRLLLDSMRRLRARERGYLAGFLHDGPIQELAAATLELGETRRTMRTQPSAELGVGAQPVGAARRCLRYLQDARDSLTPPASALSTARPR